MDLFTLFSLIAAGFIGATLGSFLLVSLLYSALLKNQVKLNDTIYIYKRLYRLNSVLCLLGGVCAALVNNQKAALMMAILAVSYVFNHAHILKGIISCCDELYVLVDRDKYRSLHSLQNLMHLMQILGAGYSIYLLAILH